MKDNLRKLREILELFCGYADHCRSWDPEKEDDFDDLEAGVLEILASEGD